MKTMGVEGKIEETYLFLSEETPEKIKKFTRLLWQAPIPRQYIRIGSDENTNIGSYLTEVKKADLINRLIIAQDFSSGRVIRFLIGNDKGEKAEFCCAYNEFNAMMTERLFKKTFGYGFADYPNKQVTTPGQK